MGVNLARRGDRAMIYWTWQLPQTLIGFILCKILRGRKKVFVFEDFGKVECWVCPILRTGSVTLGKYILLCLDHANDELIVRHEHGHQLQGMLLGWLYLLVIGVPSLVWCLFIHPRKHGSYYDFWTERWANKLGKVVIE